MVRYTEDAKLANNGLVELSEECQLAINGGCSNGLSAEEKAAIIFFFMSLAADHS
ncbi:MAG: hypothetical protein UHN47_15295 [Lachnospiraceae bacterium]|nr:hypothetical protein [Lachnospiraceae bacterium]MEE1257854.1 hypothetical protein [Lachnospiraceae bacterium]